ncbi:asparagine synthase-related protein [Mucilaginibacter paludis]|uniref:asparagine synthase (glutamine-hydrolyzing) n=1 Tax=Mucilaginibacter paludis DSM 18603 TaxID=714943 RepID=H1Y2B8_9SPHI|nr:asparagine synthase-related protein [Mucilaginibacter paludis]EHQ27898.1 asparagine synthase [Mucilaginibacter paludis DSM 18603]
MSAIFGIIDKTGRNTNDETIAKIQNTLAHRAVNSSGQYHQANVFLRHHNLITNIYQKNEQLPFEDERFVVVSDAKIYNRRALSHTLGYEKKYAFLHDSKIILECYKKWQEKCTDYLEGEFVFVIWDKLSKQLFAATDHMGFRSLFYYDSPQLFVFSSEIKGIVDANFTKKIFNSDSIVRHFKRAYKGATFDTEIFELIAASQLSVGVNRPLIIKKYWFVKAINKYKFKKHDDWSDCLRELLTQAVANRLETDQNVGVLLSGGLDSSFVASIAANILAKQNKTLYSFSSVLPEHHIGPEKDERHYIKIIGKHFENMDQTFVWPDANIGPFSHLEDTFNKYSTPPFQYHYLDNALFSEVKKRDVNILLSGFGGDMTVSNRGIDSIYEFIIRGNLLKAYKYFNLEKGKGSLFEITKSRSLLQAIKAEILDNTLFFKHVYNPLRAVVKDEYVFKDHINLKINNKSSYGHPYRKDLIKNIDSGVIGKFFTTMHSYGTYYNTEYSALMMDKGLTEFFFDVPPEQFILDGQSRSLLKRAMEGIVPNEIITRDDKRAYTPDFFRRFLSQRSIAERFINNTDDDNELDFMFIDKKKMSNCSKELFATEPGLRFPVKSLMLAQAIIFEEHTQWLIKKGYQYF